MWSGTSYSPTTRLAAGDYSWRVSAMTGATGTNLMSSSALVPFTLQTTPGIPGSVAVTLAGTAIGMSWTAPSSGGAPIQGYLVRYRVGSAEWTTQTVGGDAGSITLTDVVLASTYTLQVAAQNPIGRGAFTAAKTITTASPPGAPTLLKGTASGATLTVTWSAPSSTGGSAITGYLLDYRLAGTSVMDRDRSTPDPDNDAVGPLARHHVRVAGRSGQRRRTGPLGLAGSGPNRDSDNRAGPTNPSPASPPVSSNAKVPGAPSAPMGARRRHARSALTWSAPTSNGGVASRLHGHQQPWIQDMHGHSPDLCRHRTQQRDSLPVRRDGPECRGGISAPSPLSSERHPRTPRGGQSQGCEQEGQSFR